MIVFRPPATDGEHTWVYSSWTNTFVPSPIAVLNEPGIDGVSFGGPGRFFAPWAARHAHAELVNKLLRDESVSVVMATLDTDAETALGWVCFGRKTETHGPVLHYVLVKNTVRREGVGRALVAHVTSEIGDWTWSHMTPSGGKLLHHGHVR